ncbi:acetyltransferase (GNAT) family domain-containing protein [Ditylenchus destructor]|nr:acetyltransferase (GNAT) family domain-containing protein [Ditylenchus destructor]
MPKKGPKIAAPVISKEDLDVFRRVPGKSTVTASDGHQFRKRVKKTTDPRFKEDWLCVKDGCKAHIFVTGEWQTDAAGREFMHGAWVSRSHGKGGSGHPPPLPLPPKPAAEPDAAEDIAADMTALALEEPTMRALSSEADIAAAIALAAAVLPDLPQHMRDSVIESATAPHSTAFAHGYFGTKGQLVGLIIGLKNHWTELMKMNISPLSEERRLAGANSYRTAYIALLAVDAKHRKQGIGKALVNAFVADVQPAAAVLPVPPVRPAQQDKPPNIMYLHVRKSNEAAMQFYKALKFKRHQRVDVRYYGTEDAVIFVRRLESRSASESRAPKWPSGPPTKPSKPGPKSKLRDKSTGRANIQF